MIYGLDLKKVTRIGIDCVQCEESFCCKVGCKICYLPIEVSSFTVFGGSKEPMMAHDLL